MALLASSFVVLSVSVSLITVTSSDHNVTLHTNSSDNSAKPTQQPDSGLSMLAFGVISFILILIIVMVILLTVINLKGRCHNTKEEGVKNYGSVISEGHISNNGERLSIMLISVRNLNTDTDIDSPRISYIYSTALDNEDQ